jgi:hypothetical protein
MKRRHPSDQEIVTREQAPSERLRKYIRLYQHVVLLKYRIVVFSKPVRKLSKYENAGINCKLP